MATETARLREQMLEATDHERDLLRQHDEMIQQQERSRLQAESQVYLQHDEGVLFFSLTNFTRSFTHLGTPFW